MAKETMREKIARLEKEVSELKKELQESWDREQEQNRQIIAFKEGVEEQFKETPLYIQMQRDISSLKAENSLNKSYIKTLEEVRGKQAERILKLEESIKNKKDTHDFGLEKMDSILLEIIDNNPFEEIKKIEIFNNLFDNHGVHLEILNLKNTYIKINYDTRTNRRGAGRKQKTVKGNYKLKDVEEMITKQGADETAKILGISRATFFRKLKRYRSLNNPEEYFF